MKRHHTPARQGRDGFSLIEMLIAITLVAAIATGMLQAMRTSLMSLEKVQTRLEENRRTMGVQQTILRQIGGVMPMVSNCPGGGRVGAFAGTPNSLHLVTTYSMSEGFRGYPRVVEYRVEPAAGGVQLVMNERLYTGTDSACPGNFLQPLPPGAETMVLAKGLAYCRFFYHEYLPDALDRGEWVQGWTRPNLPSAVRIEMAPAVVIPTQLPMVSLHIPIHVTRDVGAFYADQ